MVILGLDPGTATTGFGVIEYSNNNYTLLDYGCIKTSPQYSLSERLQQISEDLNSLLQEWKPETVAIEKLFFSKNVKTAMSVAHARGVLLERLSAANYEVGEYTPQQVKEAVCGYGKADKQQIQKMVQIIFNLPSPPTPDDAADALAIAVCHAHSLQSFRLFSSP